MANQRTPDGRQQGYQDGATRQSGYPYGQGQYAGTQAPQGQQYRGQAPQGQPYRGQAPQGQPYRGQAPQGQQYRSQGPQPYDATYNVGQNGNTYREPPRRQGRGGNGPGTPPAKSKGSPSIRRTTIPPRRAGPLKRRRKASSTCPLPFPPGRVLSSTEPRWTSALMARWRIG